MFGRVFTIYLEKASATASCWYCLKIVYLYKNLIIFCTSLTYRWGQGTKLKHGDYFSGPDRYNPGKLIKHKWESAQTVDKHGWAHRKNINLEDIRDMQVGYYK